ncbi:hypothetical protein RD792_016731 [Penstemon davidsonii]|uniref:Protein kinase domain-containing protein n=1 Tax=Penstemon davidsonii TaxID=160366 RepID=A0ABR0CLD6_9LAMI|nr:hypothetical protein RD792_016731 [Penstemon davidsonii]
MAESRLAFEACGSTSNENVSCYADDGSEFLDYGKVKSKLGNCSALFSSIMVGFGESVGTVSLEFQTLELGWWLNGDCNCDRNANCTPIDRGLSRKGFRCNCNEGYVGDGFADGEGCNQVSDCSARRYLSVGCGGTRVGVLIGGIIAGASLVAALTFICYCMKKRSTILRNRLSARRLLSEVAGNSNVPFYPYKEIEKATNGFSEKQRLGTGAYGTVYAGKLHNKWVAIKKIRHRDKDSVEQVMNEIKLLSSVSHPNLVRLLGCCIENTEQILVYEYMPNGTLSQHLQRERGSVLPWTVRLTIATETAHAITHLHSATNPPIYHRDIKSSNILLDYNFNSKVADFGLSRSGMTVDDSHISTAPQGTPGYVDPQYHQNFHLSDKSDVYSFGVVLLEIITAMKVVDFSRPHSEINLAALAIDRIGKGRIDEIIDPFLELNRDAWTLSSVHKMAELAFRCLAFHRDMRPSMMEVADELEMIRLSGWAPLDENICMGSSVASSCSSPYYESEKSTSKETGISSRRLIVPQRVGDGGLSKTEEAKDHSPVSVQDHWLSEDSSPSTNSLLGNVGK